MQRSQLLLCSSDASVWCRQVTVNGYEECTGDLNVRVYFLLFNFLVAILLINIFVGVLLDMFDLYYSSPDETEDEEITEMFRVFIDRLSDDKYKGEDNRRLDKSWIFNPEINSELKYSGITPSDMLRTHREIGLADDFMLPATIAARVPTPMYIRDSENKIMFCNKPFSHLYRFDDGYHKDVDDLIGTYANFHLGSETPRCV